MSKRFAVNLLLWAAITVVATGLLCLAPLLDNGFGNGFWPDFGAVAAVTAFGGLLSAGLVYLGYWVKSLQSLNVSQEDLGATEMVLKQTRASLVHYRTGRPWRFWEAVGGKLFLTSSRLIFRTHAGQPCRYELVMPLTELARADPCRIMGLPNGLTIERTDGTKELFGCGLESVEEWASAIKVLRTMGPMVEGRSGNRMDSQGVAGRRGTPPEADEGYKHGSA